MDFNEYQTKSRETAIYPNLGNNLWYPTLGLGGESSELLDKIISCEGNIRFGKVDKITTDQLKKELGDIMWYVSNVGIESNIQLSLLTLKSIDGFQESCNQLNYSNMYITLVLEAGRLNTYSGRVLEIVKKTYRDDNGILSIKRRDDIITNLGELLNELATLCNLLDISLVDVLITNLSKLNKRMSEGKLHGDGDNR